MSDEPIIPPADKPKKPNHLIAFGRPARMILESEILAAQSMSKTEQQVARKLGVSFVTYQKYAKLYGIYGRVKNRAGKGVNKPIQNEDSGKYPLDRILNGEFPDYPAARLRLRLIRSNRMEPKCCACGFGEMREIDKKYPLVLTFKDGNKKNKKADNLQFYCYNCCFLHVNNPHGRRTTFKMDGVPNKETPNE